MLQKTKLSLSFFVRLLVAAITRISSAKVNRHYISLLFRKKLKHFSDTFSSAAINYTPEQLEGDRKSKKKGPLLFLFQTFVQSIFVLEKSTEISLVMRLISLVVFFWSSFWNSRVRLGSPSLGEDAWNREEISNSTFSLLMQFKLEGTLGS